MHLTCINFLWYMKVRLASIGSREQRDSVLLCFLLNSALLLLSSHKVSCQQGPVFACDVSKNTTWGTFPYCNTSLAIDVRVADLVNRMTLQEKIKLIVSTASSVDRLGIPNYEWWSEGLHGVSNTGPGVKFNNIVPGATSFPTPILTAASFNTSLFRDIARVTSTEGRAMYNTGLSGLSYWSPTVNILRDPRWGRAMEVPGEDPFLTSIYAVNFVKGLQDTDGDDPNRLKIAACCKHYTAYDLDNWKGTDRFHFNAIVTKQDMEDTFQPPFRSCVLDGNVSSVMCSYNQVNGKPTCADPELLQGIIRGQWKLNGYIVSDCDSVQVMFEDQHYTERPEESAAKAIQAGLDLDCGMYLANYTGAAIQEGLVNETEINRAVSNNFATLMRLGFFDGDPTKGPYGKLGPKDVCTQEHQELAREAARQGIVLLKNSPGSLPLPPNNIKTLAVIGPNANVTTTMIGIYAGIPCNYTTPLQGLSTLVSTTYEPGCPDVACENPLLENAMKIAGTSDATIVIVGADTSIEREALDRTSLLLPGQQQNLVTQVALVSKGPCILVVMSGGAMDVTFAKNDQKITSILWVGYPGQAGGAAIADVIFGLHNPSGRLPHTWYPQSYVDKVPMTIMNMRPNSSSDYPGRTYRFYTGQPVYSFGDGLSYTTFEYLVSEAPISVSIPLGKHDICHSRFCASVVAPESCRGSAFTLHVKVKNTGKMNGSHTVLFFTSPPAMHNAPRRKLVGFQKVFLKANAEAAVKFKIDACRDLSVADENGRRKIPLGRHLLLAGRLSHPVIVKI